MATTISNVVTYSNKKHVSVAIADVITQLSSALPFTSDLAYDAEKQTLSWKQNGDSVSMDLKQYLVDIHTSGVSLDGATLIIKETDGTEYKVDLAALAKSSTNNSTTVSLTGDGSGLNPLKAEAIVSATKGNLLTKETDGLAAKLKTPVVESITADGSKLTVKTVATDGTESSKDIQLAGSTTVDATTAVKLKTSEDTSITTVGIGDRDTAMYAGKPVTVLLPSAADPTKLIKVVLMDYSAYIDATE